MRKALYVLGELEDADLEWMIANGDRREVAQGTRLINQGEALDSMFILLRGRFSVTDQNLGDRELAVLQSGEIVGEMSFVEARPPTATVTATEPGLVLGLPLGELQAKLETDTGMAARFYRALAVFLSDRMRATVRTLGYGDAKVTVDEDGVQDDELDLNVLDKVHLAGERFDQMLKRLSA
ncbi:cyclic nucleotide-binding domain-containing protein [bacterium]|nr:cyclic nucleotide-binding domain-containing protein [bacterium]